MQKIAKVSSIIRAVIAFVFILHIFTYVGVMFFGDKQGAENELAIETQYSNSLLRVDFDGSWKDMALALEQEGFDSVAILGSVESIPYLLVYFWLFKLFSYYRAGNIFTQQTIRCLKNVGTTLLLWILVSILYPVVVTIVIRFGGFSETLPIIINFGSTELKYLAVGLIVYVIAWVMQEALSLQSEQELVI